MPIAQSYSFSDENVVFNSKFYNTTRNDIYRDTYEQEMEDSSVFWYTIFSEYNETAYEKHRDEMNNWDKVSRYLFLNSEYTYRVSH